MRRFITLTIFVTLLMSALQAQVRFVPDAESSLWIEGSATTVNFTCDAEFFEGWGEVDIDTSEKTADPSAKRSGTSSVVYVQIPVEHFDCGRQRMNRDFKEALKADKYSHIRFSLLHAEEITSDSDEYARFIITGELTVAGVSRVVDIEVEGYPLDLNEYKVKGSKEIKMTDFEVTPPTALMGLVQTRDELTVHFDITVKPDQKP